MRVDCGKCKSNQLVWVDAKVVSDDVQQGRLNSSEVNTYFYQICEDCGEIVVMLSSNQIANMLNNRELSK